MELYILRHAIAETRDPFGSKRDSDRSLTPDGAAKMERIARGMKALELSFDLILSSPFLRAKQTADIVARVFRMKKGVKLLPALAAGADPKELIDELSELRRQPDSLLLVGHEPDLSELISHLLAGDPSLSITLKKGGLCKLTVESLEHDRCAVLEWLLTPGQLVSLR